MLLLINFVLTFKDVFEILDSNQICVIQIYIYWYYLMVELKVTNTNQTVNLFNGKKPFPFSVQKERGFFIYHHGYLRFAIFSFQQYYTTLIGHGLHRWVNIDEVCDATCYRKHSSYCNDSTVSHLRRWIRGYFSFFRMIIISSQYSKFKLEQRGKQNYQPLVSAWA